MIVVGLFFLISVFVLGVIFGRFILKPVLVATRGKSCWRFYTSDFFSLTLVLALPAIYVSRFDRLSLTVIVIGGVVFLIAIWSWIRGAAKLSAIGVNSPLKRFLFLGGVLPVVVMGIGFAIPWTLVLLISSMNLGFENPVMIILALMGIPLAALLCRQICEWVVNASNRQECGLDVDVETEAGVRTKPERRL